MKPTEKPDTVGRTTFYIAAAILVASFVWRILVPAHQYLLTTDLYIQIFIDAMLALGVLGGGLRLLQTSGGITPRDPLPIIVFWIAIIAAVGLFGIRLTSKEASWTGHLYYSLSPRR